MRDTLFPPPWFFDTKDAATSPAARRVHEICNRAVWRSLGAADRLRAAALAIAWPVVAVGFGLPLVWRNAAAVRALTGKGALRQLGELVCVAVRYRAVPK